MASVRGLAHHFTSTGNFEAFGDRLAGLLHGGKGRNKDHGGAFVKGKGYLI